jgi:hypothetical protein
MKRGKSWSRGDKIAFGSLLGTILSVFIALLFPEFRIWLHLEKKPAPLVVAPKFEPLPAVQSAEPTPTPALENVKNPHTCVKITIDRMMEDPKFGVVCARACKAVFGDIILPNSGGGKQKALSLRPGGDRSWQSPSRSGLAGNQQRPEPQIGFDKTLVCQTIP